jgi:hypothetical protein
MLTFSPSWSFFPDNPCSLPRQLEVTLRTNLAHVRLHISIHPIRIPAEAPIDWANITAHRTIAIPSIPSENLDTIDVEANVSEGDLGSLLLSASRLRKLTIFGEENKIIVPEVRKLPPLQALDLGSDVHSAANIWDFSQLQSLTPDGADFVRFGTTQSAKSFPVLWKLSIYDHG